ncbi:HlyD family secretion protein [Microbaculum marinisediminis]|uniref:HlyD family efflux transporter periplasmic adaptor subunit n=1 Tax=Microbaculum marinisediminis TaxID=2931392 RepID=A0AAW5R5F6_9HYPH|nr:HlyD family secretion protein [Microbaculum sp. A6E488]MCT8973921.1 HlyD family efflux transporter periplasmic adaptor subunit [Microbaculum sp. A6E488]
MPKAARSILRLVLIAVAAGGLYAAWLYAQPPGVPKGFAKSNGRIEAVEIYIAAKTAGRVQDVYVSEGQFVKTGDKLAKIDTRALEAQLREAQAQLESAKIGVTIAESRVRQQEAQKASMQALIEQRQAELTIAEKSLARAEELATTGTATQQRLDEDRANVQGAKAAVSAAVANLAASDAALGFARSQVIAAKSDIEAVRATIDRIQVEIDDSLLAAPRDGRVQYIVARPGEVVGPGNTVLNMVDLDEVYMTFFLPTAEAGVLAVDAEARLILDAASQYVIPAKVFFVADVAQFTPKTVETTDERQKLMFRVKARIPSELLREYVRNVKTGLPGIAYVRLDPTADWPEDLKVRLPEDTAAG